MNILPSGQNQDWSAPRKRLIKQKDAPSDNESLVGFCISKNAADQTRYDLGSSILYHLHGAERATNPERSVERLMYAQKFMGRIEDDMLALRHTSLFIETCERLGLEPEMEADEEGNVPGEAWEVDPAFLRYLKELEPMKRLQALRHLLQQAYFYRMDAKAIQETLMLEILENTALCSHPEALGEFKEMATLCIRYGQQVFHDRLQTLLRS